MTLFLSLLPSDLHICVLQTWIGGDHGNGRDAQLLKALSALDIACCTSKHRKPWLELAASLHFKGKVSIRRSTVCYMLWLASRSMAVSCLFLEEPPFGSRPAGNDWLTLADHPAFTLPAVSELIVSTFADQQTLDRVMACCPNLTSISSTTGQQFWKILAAHPDIGLKALSGTLPDVAQAALLVHGQHLLRLELEVKVYARKWNSAAILATLPLTCPVLESLSLMDCYLYLPGLLAVLGAWSTLTELVLQPYNLLTDVLTIADTVTAATSILEACCLKRFTITVDHLISKELEQQAFAQLLTAHPELDHFKFQSCSYCRRTRHLRCPIPNVDAAECILEVCSAVRPLSLWVASSPPMLAIVVAGCASLVKLELGHFRYSDDLRIAINAIVRCKQLQSLIFCLGHNPSDDDMEVLLAGLPCLKELKICTRDRITFRTLQAIVDNKRCLDRFCCGPYGFPAHEVNWFRLLAKEAGILPMSSIRPYYG